MKRASSPCGLFIKKQEETLINSAPLSLAAYCHCVRGRRGRLWNLTVYRFYGEIFRQIWIFLHNFAYVWKPLSIMWSLKPAEQAKWHRSPLLFFFYFITVWFSVLSFQHAALIKTPRTRRQVAKNILYMCQLTAPCSVCDASLPKALYSTLDLLVSQIFLAY